MLHELEVRVVFKVIFSSYFGESDFSTFAFLFSNYSRLSQYPKHNCLKQLEQVILQATCLFCRPTNGVRTLTGTQRSENPRLHS